jgi:predicted CxxxxCH...CXXCH cytochrome family protein
MNPAKMTRAILCCAAMLALASGLAPGFAFAANMTINQGAAHASHTQDNPARVKLSCGECHAPVCSPAGNRNVVFGDLARSGGAAPAWDPTARSCSNVYCHGSGSAPVAWTYVYTPVAPTPAVECAMCHGYPPVSHSPGSTSCNGCHPGTVKTDGTIDIGGGKHIDGTLDVTGGTGGSGCAGCHGFPPATGAHVAHFGLGVTAGSYVEAGNLEDRFPGVAPSEAPAVYAFGCANCHSVISGNHRNGAVEVLLYEAAAPAGSMKARNATTAAFNATAKTCSNVYCHSSGQEAPAFVSTPGWYSGAHLSCAGCHSNPPRYPSGGPGSLTANSHLDLADDGYETGHFMGMPGPWHSSKHGGNGWGAGEDTTAITCQTCHFDTTDPASTGPSSFYWLDTTGNYDLGGALGARCDSCHSTGSATAPLQAGKVLPLRHVNGKRDVTFDVRSSLPAISSLPAAPNTPTLPYWTTFASRNLPWPSDVVFNGTTLSFTLGRAVYESGTKTCTNVACHQAQGSTDYNPGGSGPVVSPLIPLRWGGKMEWTTDGCNKCHPM